MWSEFRSGFGETVFHVSDRAIRVVGQAVDDDATSARPKPLVTRHGEIFSTSTFGFVDRFFNYMRGNLISFGLFDQTLERRVRLRVRHAVFGDHIHLLAVFRIDLGLLASRLKDGVLSVFKTSTHDIALVFLIVAARRDLPCPTFSQI